MLLIAVCCFLLGCVCDAVCWLSLVLVVWLRWFVWVADGWFPDCLGSLCLGVALFDVVCICVLVVCCVYGCLLFLCVCRLLSLLLRLV